MKILVCIKQVPDGEAPLSINENQDWIEENGKVAFKMNRYDEFALEEALLIKEKYDDVIIDAVTMGPERAESVIRKALEKGADNGIHIINNKSYTTSGETSYILADYAKEKSYDLILTGIMSEDLMAAMVGPMMGAHLSIPCISSVIEETIDPEKNTVTAKSEITGGSTTTIFSKIPVLLTIQSGINEPRYPPLSSVLRAKKKEITTLHHAEMPQKNMEPVIIQFPDSTIKGTVLEGTIEEKAQELATILHGHSLL